jgi:teichuronic acid biosynthesis glycosyltransferase TuaC
VAHSFDFDLIDAHYFYPDGVAAALLGRWLGKPVVITARGSDLNLFPSFVGPRRLIRWAAHEAAAVVTVSDTLRGALLELDVDAGRITVLRNGVDTEFFCPEPRSKARQAIGLTPPGRLPCRLGRQLSPPQRSRPRDPSLYLGPRATPGNCWEWGT